MVWTGGLHKTLKKPMVPLDCSQPPTPRISDDDFTSNTLLDPVLIRAIAWGAWVGALKVDEEIDEYGWSNWSMMIVNEKTWDNSTANFAAHNTDTYILQLYNLYNYDPHASGFE